MFHLSYIYVQVCADYRTEYDTGNQPLMQQCT